MLQETDTLVVVTWSADALPEATWWTNPPKYFGLQLAYYNPRIQNMNPYTFPKDCIGFYGIEPLKAYPETVVCDICRSQIRYILILPTLPGETIKEYEEGGVNRLFQIASKTYIIEEAAMPLPLAA